MPYFASEALRGLTGRLVTLGLLHAVWVGLLAACLAALALRVVSHRRRRVRYGLLGAALATAALGPLVATSLQRWRVEPRLSETANAPAGSIRVIAGRLVAREVDAPPPSLPETASEPAVGTLGEWIDAVWSASRAGVDVVQPFVLAAWLLVVAPLSVRLVLGVRTSRTLRRGARPASESVQRRSDRLAQGLGLRSGPPVLVHPRLDEPCLCGLVRPAVLLPDCWLAGADGPRLDAVLAHELAHARRLDLPANLVQRLVEVALFFHPAVLWLSRSLRRQRELCADALAVSLTGDPLALAQALESFARNRPGRCRPALLLDESLGGDGLSLFSRIQEILGMTPTRPPARLWPLAALPAAVLLALFSASVSLAQDPPRAASNNAPKTLPQPVPESKRPAKKDALKQVVAYDFAGGSQRNDHFDIRTDNAPYSERQINYEVRFLEADAAPWRDQLKDKLGTVKLDDEAADSAWLLDKEQMLAIMTLNQKAIGEGHIQAPKVTAFDGSHVTIVNTHDQYYVADAKPLQKQETVAFKPEVKKMTLGTTLEFFGVYQPDGTNLTVDLHDNQLVAFHDLSRTGESAIGRMKVNYQALTTADQRRRLTQAVPEGSTLMISLGFQTRRVPRTGMAGVAAALLTAAGAPVSEPPGETTERLVLISPRRCILESEEVRLDSIPEGPVARP